MEPKKTTDLTGVERLAEILALVLVILVLFGCFMKVIFV